MAVPLRIVFFGTATFAVPTLEALAAQPDRFTVAAVVTQPDKPFGRSGQIKATPIAEAARRLGLRLLQPTKLKEGAVQQEIAAFMPDVFVVAAYGKIIPQALLDVPKIAPLNLHGSLLPKYRGASPIQAAILDGEKETGVSLMVMDAEVDHGAIVATAARPIDATDTHETLEIKLGEVAARLLVAKLEDFAAGKIPADAQKHEKATFTGILDRAAGLIHWDQMTAAEIERRVRAYYPWPGCYAVWSRKGAPMHLKIIKARVSDKAGDASAAPGGVELVDGALIVQAKSGWLELLEVQPEGKKAMAAVDFLNGYRDIVGSVLESNPAK